VRPAPVAGEDTGDGGRGGGQNEPEVLAPVFLMPAATPAALNPGHGMICIGGLPYHAVVASYGETAEYGADVPESASNVNRRCRSVFDKRFGFQVDRWPLTPTRTEWTSNR